MRKWLKGENQGGRVCGRGQRATYQPITESHSGRHHCPVFLLQSNSDSYLFRIFKNREEGISRKTVCVRLCVSVCVCARAQCGSMWDCETSNWPPFFNKMPSIH